MVIDERDREGRPVCHSARRIGNKKKMLRITQSLNRLSRRGNDSS